MRRSKMALATALAAVMIMGATPCAFAAPSPTAKELTQMGLVEGKGDVTEVTEVTESPVFAALSQETQDAITGLLEGKTNVSELVEALEVPEEKLELLDGMDTPVAAAGIKVELTEDGEAEVTTKVDTIGDEEKDTAVILVGEKEVIVKGKEDVTVDTAEKTVTTEITKEDKATSENYIEIVLQADEAADAE